MANTYESKFKGVEVDEGVNIARNLTGTGGIEVKKTATGTINATVTIDGSGVKITPVSGTGTSTTDVMSQKAVTDELGKKQDKLTVSSNVHINSLTVAATSAADGLYFTNETGAGISYRILNAAGSGTAPLTRLTVPNDIAGKTQTIATREYVNAHSSSYNPGSGINISGNTISLAERIMVDNITLGNYSSGNVILLPQSGASGNVYFPKYGGYLATTNDIPAPSKLYLHNIIIGLSSTASALNKITGDRGWTNNVSFSFYSSKSTQFTSLKEVHGTIYGYTANSHASSTVVKYRDDVSEQGQVYVISIYGNSSMEPNVKFCYQPTANMPLGYIEYTNITRFQTSFTDKVTEV